MKLLNYLRKVRQLGFRINLLDFSLYWWNPAVALSLLDLHLKLVLGFLKSLLQTFLLNLLGNAVNLASVQFTSSARRKLHITISTGESLSDVLLLEGFLTIDVVHFNVGAPALPGKDTCAPEVHAPEVQFGHLVVLLVDLCGIDARREKNIAITELHLDALNVIVELSLGPLHRLYHRLSG